MGELPFVDEHSRAVTAAPPAAWEATLAVATAMAQGDAGPLGRILGVDPRAGFEVAEVVEGERVALAGRHRFSRYRAELRVEPLGEGSLVRFRTLAEFPGPHGRVYRGLVIGSRGHVIGVKWILRRIARRADQASARVEPSSTARRSSGAAR